MNGVTRTLGAVALVLSLGACSKSQLMAPNGTGNSATASRQVSAQSASTVASANPTKNSGSEKGAGGEMPAFYDGNQITINSVEVSDVAAEQIGANPSHNSIFVTNDLDDPQDFLPVIDAIQGDGFNPLWEQFRIVFNPGVTPHQFHSDDEVNQAASGPNPEITLVDTHEVYRCSVVGAK